MRAWRSFDSFEERIVSSLALPDRHQRLPQRDESGKHPQRSCPTSSRPRPAKMPEAAGDRRGVARALSAIAARRDADDPPIPRRATRRARPCSSPLSPSFSAAAAPAGHAPAVRCARLVGREAATLLGGSTASIDSALQRARETIAKRYPRAGQPKSVPDSAQKNCSAGICKPGKGSTVDGFVALLKEDATDIMPPWPNGSAGREAIGTFFGWAWKPYDGFRLCANGSKPGSQHSPLISRTQTRCPLVVHIPSRCFPWRRAKFSAHPFRETRRSTACFPRIRTSAHLSG